MIGRQNHHGKAPAPNGLRRTARGRLVGMLTLKGTIERTTKLLRSRRLSAQSSEDKIRADTDVDSKILPFLKKIPTPALRETLKHWQDSTSQIFQDLFVLNCLDFKRNGYFVEFGAGDGLELSNTWLLEKTFGWQGIVAEPGLRWHEALRNNRACHIDTDCVWTSSGATMSFTDVELGGLSTLTAFVASDFHAPTREEEVRARYDVTTVSLEDLLLRYNAPNLIDYLSIDTEGSELDILTALDHSKFRFKVITVEHNYTDQRDKIRDLLSAHGYRRLFQDVSQFDDWYVLPPHVVLEEPDVSEQFHRIYRKAQVRLLTHSLTRPFMKRDPHGSSESNMAPAQDPLPMLLDLLAGAPRRTKLLWIGSQNHLYTLFCRAWRRLGFKAAVELWQEGDTAAFDEADSFVVDFGSIGLAGGDAHVLSGLCHAIESEIDRLRGTPNAPRRFVGVNARGNRFEDLMKALVGGTRTPVYARLYHGYLASDVAAQTFDWTKDMLPGPAGNREGTAIGSNGASGHVFYGPYRLLLSGRYMARVTLSGTDALRERPAHVTFDLVISQESRFPMTAHVGAGTQTIDIPFAIEPSDFGKPVEIRLYTNGKSGITLNTLIVTRDAKRL